jgi:hypothetical protein
MSRMAVRQRLHFSIGLQSYNAFSILIHFRELLHSLILLTEAGHGPAVIYHRSISV